MECLLPYLCMVTVPHIMVRLERMLDYRGVGLARFHCIIYTILCTLKSTMYPLTLIYVCVSLLSVMCMYILHEFCLLLFQKDLHTYGVITLNTFDSMFG